MTLWPRIWSKAISVLDSASNSSWKRKSRERNSSPENPWSSRTSGPSGVETAIGRSAWLYFGTVGSPPRRFVSRASVPVGFRRRTPARDHPICPAYQQ